MSDIVFVAAADAIKLALVADGVAGGRVFHIYPDDAALATSAVAIGFEAADPGPALLGSPVDWDATLRVDCYHRFGVSALNPHDGVTELFGAVFASLMGGVSLGASAMSFEAGPAAWNYADDERRLALVTSRFTVRLRTAATTLEAP